MPNTLNMFQLAGMGLPVTDYEELLEDETHDTASKLIGVYSMGKEFLCGAQEVSNPKDKVELIRELKRRYGKNAKVYAVPAEEFKNVKRFSISKGQLKGLETFEASQKERVRDLADIIMDKFGKDRTANVNLCQSCDADAPLYIHSIVLFDC
jgi:hypothetical protein